MARVPTGSTNWIATTIAAAKTTTIVTNAAEAVVTSAAHGYSNGDVVIVGSGWGRLHNRAFRIKSITTDTFVLEGADTANTTLFSPGTGIGSVRKVTAFTQVTTVMAPSSSGGEPKTVSYKFQEDENEYTLNDGFSPVQRSINLDADSIGTAGYTALKTFTDSGADTVWRTNAKSGAVSYLVATVSLNEEEIITDGQIVQVKCAISGRSRSTRYAS